MLLLLFGFVIASLNPPTKLIEHSLENDKKIQADFELVGAFTQSFLHKNNRVVTDAELKQWAKDIEFQIISMDGENGNLWITESGDTCGAAGEAKLPTEKRLYLLCYWRGEWVEEFSPETSSTSVPSKKSDYDFTKQNWRDLLLVIILVGGLALLIWPKRAPRMSAV